MHAITISREYGSGGRTVGYKVARRLGYAFVDHALIVAVSAQSQGAGVDGGGSGRTPGGFGKARS